MRAGKLAGRLGETEAAFEAEKRARAELVEELGCAEKSRRQVDDERERLSGELSQSAARLAETRERVTVVEGDLETTRQKHAKAAQSRQALETALQMVAISLGSASVGRVRPSAPSPSPSKSNAAPPVTDVSVAACPRSMPPLLRDAAHFRAGYL